MDRTIRRSWALRAVYMASAALDRPHPEFVQKCFMLGSQNGTLARWLKTMLEQICGSYFKFKFTQKFTYAHWPPPASTRWARQFPWLSPPKQHRWPASPDSLIRRRTEIALVLGSLRTCRRNWWAQWTCTKDSPPKLWPEARLAELAHIQWSQTDCCQAHHRPCVLCTRLKLPCRSAGPSEICLNPI